MKYFNYLDMLTDDILNVIFDMATDQLESDLKIMSHKVSIVKSQLSLLTKIDFHELNVFKYNDLVFDLHLDSITDLFRPFHIGKVRFYNKHTDVLSEKYVNPSYFQLMVLADHQDDDYDILNNLLEEPELLCWNEASYLYEEDVKIFSLTLEAD